MKQDDNLLRINRLGLSLFFLNTKTISKKKNIYRIGRIKNIRVSDPTEERTPENGCGDI